jgi:hypothetical protein
MKLTLLLLWSLGSAPLYDACQSCQTGGPGPADGAYQSAPYQSSPFGAPAGAFGPGGASIGSTAQFNEFSSPCGDYNGGNGGGVGRCNGRGRCQSCCKDSTCNMYQHYPYFPTNHGYYYFAPYNYTMVWAHQQWITTIGGDPRNPYTRAMFIPIYEQFENTVYEPDHKPSQTLNPLPGISKKLPDLEDLIKRPEGDIPTAVPTEPTTPAPVPNPPVPDSADVKVPEPEPAVESKVPDFDKIPATDK